MLSKMLKKEGIPHTVLNAKFHEKEAEIVATIVCGDSYFNENLEAASEKVLSLIQAEKPDMVIAGPAFNAGRYGMACGTVCNLLVEKGITAITAMYDENPGVDVFKKNIYIFITSFSFVE